MHIPQKTNPTTRPRARALGIAPGILPTGRLNAITDVRPVKVGHVTVIDGDDIRTGATAILPHADNVYQNKVPAGIAVGNGYGKLAGSTQIRELGEIETPIVLTNTLCVPRAADAILDWVLTLSGNEAVTTVNPVVGETNDGRLNNIRKRVLTPEIIRRAIDRAADGSVEEGSVGAGTGSMAFGWKGGIGSSSRRLPKSLGGYTLGALVQSNFGGVLQILGKPVGKALGRYFLKDSLDNGDGDGSIMMVLATDAPLSDRNLSRLARRALFGLARTGASFSNGSGDYAIAFSVADAVRRTPKRRRARSAIADLPNELISALFQGAIEATEEAILNSLFKATTISGYRGFIGEAIPLKRMLTVLGGNSTLP
ncbi:P1 family peptidase [Desulfosarcina sp.]|uniref:DmpA family aminopeptidase n=1 Tax=Desulfosarcina sp. TaxID=2027861 RepID=UPI0039709EF9